MLTRIVIYIYARIHICMCTKERERDCISEIKIEYELFYYILLQSNFIILLQNNITHNHKN